MRERELNLGHLAEEFSKLLVDVPAAPHQIDETISLEEGERREVTILFLDIVGYTKLAERLDPEQLKFVMSNTLLVFTNQIKKCGGMVEKYVGDAIMAIFGRAQAHEDDSRRSVAAARAILERIDDINSILSQKGLAISARIGINRGLVVTGRIDGHDTVTGEAINIAQRLEANAPEDGILISDRVFEDCRQHYQCEQLQPLHVKNVTRPLTVYLVKEPLARATEEPAATKGLFVGRDGEVATLRNAWQHARQGQMHVVRIHGEAGMGKRELVHAMLGGLRTEGLVITPIVVRADSFGMAPYHVLSDLVRNYLAGAAMTLSQLCETVADQSEGLADYCLYLNDLTGADIAAPDRELLERMEPRARQAETILAMKRFLVAAAQAETRRGTAPLVVVLDNLQWVTHASRDACSQILNTIATTAPILWVFVGRNSEESAWIPGRISATMLTLGPLDLAATTAILQARFPEREFPAHLCAQIHARTGGNPFFLGELATVLESVGELSVMSLEEFLPGTIKALMLSRIDHLPRQQKFALQVGAVAGREFSEGLLAHVLARIQYDSAAAPVIQELRDAQLVKGDGESVVVAQPMMAEVAYTTILYTNRRKLHSLVAQWVEEHRAANLGMYAPYLADQWERAEEPAKAVPYCLGAARAARKQYAYRDAAQFFEWSLRLCQSAPQAMPPDEISYTYLMLVELHVALGERAKVWEFIREGLAHSTPGSATYLRLQLYEIEAGNRYGDRAAAPKALDAFIAGLDVQQQPEIMLRALLMRSGFSQERGEDDTLFIEQAVALRDHVQDRGLLYWLDNNVFNHFKNADELKQAEEHFTRVLASGTENAYEHHMGDLFYCSFMWDRGVDFASIAERAMRAQEYFREVGWARGVGWGAFYRGASLWRLGQLSLAHTVFTKGLQDMERAGDGYMIDRLELLLSAVFLFRGDMVGYQLRKARLLARAEALPEAERLAMHREFAMFEGQVVADRHELVKAHEVLLSTRRAPLAKVEQDEYTVMLAQVAAQLGQAEEASLCLEQVRAHIHENGKLWLMALCARVEGMLATARKDHTGLHRAFTQSVDLCQQVGAAFDTYLTYRAWWHAVEAQHLQDTPEGKGVADGLAQHQPQHTPL